MRQHTGFFSIFDRNYNQQRVLNETLLNNIVAALWRTTVQTQRESIPFPNERRFFGRTVSQGEFFSPPPVQSQRPTYSWGGNSLWRSI